MIEKAVSRHWTPEAEKHYERVLAGCLTYTQRDLVMGVRDLLKYDLRTRAGKRAVTQGRLRIAVVTDEELEEIASFAVVAENDRRIEKGMTVEELLPLQEVKVEELKELREALRKKGIKRSDLKCTQP